MIKKTAHSFSYLCLASWLIFMSSISHATPSIAVLEFELKDLTLAPYTEAEIKRTASIKPLLINELKKSDFSIIDITSDAQKKVESGVGYLFAHHDVAAKLGKDHQADYIIVGRLHKPSFLFAYLMVHLIDVKTGKLIGNYISESKGGEKKLTLKAVESLVVKINKTFTKIAIK